MKPKNRADEVWKVPVRKEAWFFFAVMERFLLGNRIKRGICIYYYPNRDKKRLKQWFKAFRWMDYKKGKEVKGSE